MALSTHQQRVIGPVDVDAGFVAGPAVEAIANVTKCDVADFAAADCSLVLGRVVGEALKIEALIPIVVASADSSEFVVALGMVDVGADGAVAAAAANVVAVVATVRAVLARIEVAMGVVAMGAVAIGAVAIGAVARVGVSHVVGVACIAVSAAVVAASAAVVAAYIAKPSVWRPPVPLRLVPHSK
jgi:hypothetical protein